MNLLFFRKGERSKSLFGEIEEEVVRPDEKKTQLMNTLHTVILIFFKYIFFGGGKIPCLITKKKSL